MLAVKRLYGFSYADTERHVWDNLTLRWFCRVYFNPVFNHSNLNKWALLIQPETLHAFNERITAIATSLKVTRGRKLRTDGTVVESNIHYPSDSSLLADGVRVLSRSLKRAKQLVMTSTDLVTTIFRDRSRSAHQQTRRIADTASKRSEAARTRLTRVSGLNPYDPSQSKPGSASPDGAASRDLSAGATSGQNPEDVYASD